MKLPHQRAISFTPYAEEWKEYNLSYLRNDVWAALAVALMTIPQSIAYSLLAGLPPTAGLFSAIFGTIFAAALGSSRHLISGPSTGTAILIQTSIADILGNYFESVSGAQKEALVLHILTQMILIMGVIQIAAAFFNVSKLLQFVSRPVVLGYFAGITVAIVVTQLFYFTGISPDLAADSVSLKAWVFISHIFQIHGPTALIGFISLGVLIFLRRTLKNWPDALIMLIIAVFLANAFNLWFGEAVIARLGDYEIPAAPTPQLTLPLLDFSLLNKVFPSAVAISFLAILEVFSISRTFAAKSGHQVQVNQDVFGLGVSNALLSFVSGSIPASGSATRTSLSYRLNAKTRFAAILSGLFTAIIIFFCWPLVQHIPLAALAALLMLTVPALMNWSEIKLCFHATREDAWVFLITFFSCLVFSLDMAFFIGILISIATFLRKSSTPHLVEYAFNSKGRLIIVNTKEDVHRKVRIIGIAGELYFASADVFQSALQSIAEDRNVQAIVLRLNNIYHMDASMCLAILRLYDSLKSTGRFLVISGLTEEVWHVFHRSGLVKQIGLDNLYFTDESNPQFSTWKACLRAQDLVHGEDK
ncbi:MAG TPA: SulP family inorganic anion transporter [Chlamydiales bacterium]|nr:SulP family inorganic anion transporter [Chlamydiales bacterium]